MSTATELWELQELRALVTEANAIYARDWRRTKGIGAHHYPITVDPRTADIPTLGGVLAANFRAGA